MCLWPYRKKYGKGKKGRKGKENKASSLPFLDHIIKNNKNEKGKEEMKEGKTHLSSALQEEIKGEKRTRKGRESKASPLHVLGHIGRNNEQEKVDRDAEG